MPAATFPELLAREKPLILPGVYDGLSARIAGQAGFGGLFVSGFSVTGGRFGVPDVGLRGLADISGAVRDIMRASDLPVFVDIDDGYGDVKNAVNTLHDYERLGAAAVMIEDQTWPKRCGHLAGKTVVPIEDAVAKVRAVCAERANSATIISARTDARTPNGLDDALRRAEKFLEAGADWLFIEAPESVEELEIIGRTFAGVPLLANPLEGGRTPILPPAELGEMGFDIIPYGLSAILHVTKVLGEVFADMRSQELKLYDKGASFEDYKKIIGLDEWTRIEETYRP